MNPLTFNDSLPKGLAESVVGREYCDVWGEAMSAPIFLINDPEKDELMKLADESSSSCLIPYAHELFEGIHQGRPVLPFKEIRIECVSNSEDAIDLAKTKSWVLHRDGTLYAIIQDIGKDPKTTQIYLSVFKFHGGDRMDIKSEVIFTNGQCVTAENFPDKGARVRLILRRRLTSIIYLFQRIDLGAEFIASVHPDSQGKSVEWVKARTHYVLLHRKHPANSDSVIQGASVRESGEYIQRQAHSRRAHFRILRSSRYRVNGQRIRVRSCWVGPKEWKQFGSIYKLAQ